MAGGNSVDECCVMQIFMHISSPQLSSESTDFSVHRLPPHLPYLWIFTVQAAEYTRTSQLDSITIPQAPRLGSQVVEVNGLCKSYGDRLLMKDLSFSVPPGSVVGTHHSS